MIRIIAGKRRGTQLLVSPDQRVRPSSSRLREALFNVLEHQLTLSDFLVWDAYAGSGSLGLEAWSRGAEEVRFTEISPETFAVLKKNLKKCGLHESWALRISARQWLGSYPLQRPLLAFLDPPYQSSELEHLLPRLQQDSIPSGSLIVVEIPAKATLTWPLGLKGWFSRAYGTSRLEMAIKESPTPNGVL